MPITGTTPIPIPAQTIDTYWLASLRVQAPAVSGAVRVSAILKPLDNAGGFAPLPAVQYHLDDLFAAAATDAELADVMNRLLAKLQDLARADGLI